MKRGVVRIVIVIVAVLVLVSAVPASAYYVANKTNGEIESGGGEAQVPVVCAR